MKLYGEQVDACDTFASTTDGHIMFSVPRAEGEYPLKFTFGSDSQTVTFYVPPGGKQHRHRDLPLASPSQLGDSTIPTKELCYSANCLIPRDRATGGTMVRVTLASLILTLIAGCGTATPPPARRTAGSPPARDPAPTPPPRREGGATAGTATSAKGAITALEAYVRWRRARFQRLHPSAKLSTLRRPAVATLGGAALLRSLIPLRGALPPKYQKASSLHIQLDHAAKALDVEWHWQRPNDSTTHRTAKKHFGAARFAELTKALAAPFACTVAGRRGWAGPSPKVLAIARTGSPEEVIYAGGARGPLGPGRKLRFAGQRRHLCSDPLRKQLAFFGANVR